MLLNLSPQRYFGPESLSFWFSLVFLRFTFCFRLDSGSAIASGGSCAQDFTVTPPIRVHDALQEFVRWGWVLRKAGPKLPKPSAVGSIFSPAPIWPPEALLRTGGISKSRIAVKAALGTNRVIARDCCPGRLRYDTGRLTASPGQVRYTSYCDLVSDVLTIDACVMWTSPLCSTSIWYLMLRHSVSGPEIGFPARISAGF